MNKKSQFFVQFILEHKNKFATKKGNKNFYLKFVFLLMKKCISFNFIYENFMIGIFSD